MPTIAEELAKQTPITPAQGPSTAIAGQLATNPFALNFASAARNRAMADALRAQGQRAVATRTALASQGTQNQSDLRSDILLSIIDQMGDTGLPIADALSMAGVQASPGITSADALNAALRQAAGIKDVGSGIDTSAQGGFRLTPQADLQQSLGVTGQEVTPTGALSSTGNVPKANVFRDGVGFTVPLPGGVPADVTERIQGGAPPAGPQATPQQSETLSRLQQIIIDPQTQQLRAEVEQFSPEPDGTIKLHVTMQDGTGRRVTYFIAPDGSQRNEPGLQ